MVCRAELQGGLHGPRADDPGDGRQEPLRVDLGGHAAHDGQQFGRDVEKLHLGAVGIYTASRNFNLLTITRRDLMSLSEECEKVTGIPDVTRAYRKEAEKILAMSTDCRFVHKM